MAIASLDAFHPVLSRWFEDTFGQPTDVQLQAWEAIASEAHTLIAAPTGSGKTLAALLPCLDRILRRKLAAIHAGGPTLNSKVGVLYITPLKALNNDIHHHIVHFMEQIEAYASDNIDGGAWPGLRSAVRTGDTTASQRAAMLRRPPDVLITTPESLFILLTTEKGRDMLQAVEQVIVDEIHGLAPDKRGAHLSVSLERLTAWSGKPIQRIGVSATQKPLERVARFLAGWQLRETVPALHAKEPSSASNAAAPLPSLHPNKAEPGGHAFPDRYEPRPIRIIESAMDKTIEVSVTVPDPNKQVQSREAVWFPIMDRILSLMEDSRSTLIFVNSRRLCERLCLRLNDYVGYELAQAHHGSLARERRLEVERLLKDGKLRAIIATSSLELGIDVGHVDLVIQIDSPLDAASGIQRIGRAGHGVGDISRGVILARQRGTLPEIAVLSRMIAARDIEEIQIPRSPLDVLSQQTVAIAATSDLQVDSLHALLLQSDSFRTLPRARLLAMLEVLAGTYPFARPLLAWDRESATIRARANTAMAAISGAGTIPQSSSYPIHHVESRSHLGELDEEFVHESRVGDVFQLGTTSWMIRDIQKDRVYVSEAANNFSEIPFWRNEGGGRSNLLGAALGKFLQLVDRKLAVLESRVNNDDGVGVPDGLSASSGESTDIDIMNTGNDIGVERMENIENIENSDSSGSMGNGINAADGDNADADASPAKEAARSASNDLTDWLRTDYGLETEAAEQLIGLVQSQRRVSIVPTQEKVVIEHYRDIMNQTHVIVHNYWGRRLNRTWLLAIERQFELLLPYRLYGNAKDNGIEFVLPEWDASWMQAIWHVKASNLQELLMEAIPGSPLLAIAFRRIAETSLLLSRSFTRTPMWQKRLRSEELLKEALPYAEHFPYLEAAVHECLHTYLDLEGLRSMLTRIGEGEIEIKMHETSHPSPFAAQFLADYVNMRIYEGDGLDQAVQLQLLQANKQWVGALFGKDIVQTALDPVIVEQEKQRLDQGTTVPRNAEQLLQVLKQRGDLSLEEIARLAEPDADCSQWLAELAAAGQAAAVQFGGQQRWLCSDEAALYAQFPDTAASVALVAGRFAAHRLSFTDEELAHRYPLLEPQQVKRVIDELLRQDKIEQAPFAAYPEERLWSSRKVAGRLVRLSVQQARKQAEPADADRWCGQMAWMQHVLHGSQLQGEEGLLTVIGQLQGFYLPLSHWETIIFPSRLRRYRSEELDRLCASGDVFWLGRKESGEKEGKVAFFLTESKALYAPLLKRQLETMPVEPEQAALLERLRSSGASFLTKLSRDTGLLPSELLHQLIELAWGGHISNDQFAPLRLYAAAKGAAINKRTGSGQGRWYWSGSLLNDDDTVNEQAGVQQTEQGASSQAGEESAVAWIHHLLQSYGLVTKELASATPFDWDTLLPIMKRLEEWGALTRGLFIRNVQTMQFTTRELATAIRQPLPVQDADSVTVLSAIDPANPYGLLMDWPTGEAGSYARKPGNYLVVLDGRWSIWLENHGRKIYTRSVAHDANAEQPVGPGLSSAVLRDVLTLVLQLQKRKKIKVDVWNGAEVSETEGGQLLLALGAERDGKSLVLWPSQLS
ncbi:DEAD/DEAH box helicase [Paenibacillaceae bacterium]|nr:DEAD/DEAH box helicase [Paenibacillaceae bacterium]